MVNSNEELSQIKLQFVLEEKEMTAFGLFIREPNEALFLTQTNV